MGIVQLDTEFFVEALERHTRGTVDAQHVLQRAGDEKVLLQKTQSLADLRLVVGVEHLTDGAGAYAAHNSTLIVTSIEGMKIEGLRGFCGPQTQQVNGVHAIAEDRGVDRHAMEGLIGQPAHAKVSLIVGVLLGVTTELDVVGNAGTANLPRIAVT